MDSTGLMVQTSFQHRLYKVKHEDKGGVFPVSPWIHVFVFFVFFLQKILQSKYICTSGCFRQAYRETDRLRAGRRWCSGVLRGEKLLQ